MHDSMFIEFISDSNAIQMILFNGVSANIMVIE